MHQGLQRDRVQQIAMREVCVRRHRPHAHAHTIRQLLRRQLRGTVPPHALNAVKSSALARLFGAVIRFEEFELLSERHFVEKQYASGIFLG